MEIKMNLALAVLVALACLIIMTIALGNLAWGW